MQMYFIWIEDWSMKNPVANWFFQNIYFIAIAQSAKYVMLSGHHILYNNIIISEVIMVMGHVPHLWFLLMRMNWSALHIMNWFKIIIFNSIQWVIKGYLLYCIKEKYFPQFFNTDGGVDSTVLPLPDVHFSLPYHTTNRPILQKLFFFQQI